MRTPAATCVSGLEDITRLAPRAWDAAACPSQVQVSCVAAMDDPGRSPDFNGIRPQRSTWQVCLAGQVTAAPVIQLLIHVCNAMAL